MSDGALLELVSRGKKDAYFIQGAQRTWFGADYARRTPVVQEYYRQEVEGPCQFGNTVDIELPHRGDIITSVDIRINLPTWLPPDIAALNTKKAYVVQIALDPTNPMEYTQCGWTNAVANFIVKRWAILADNIILTEGTGEFNSFYQSMTTEQFRAPIINQTVGGHDDSPRAIQWNATPPELLYRVPIMGCQDEIDAGLPLVAAKHQRYVVRLWLRRAEEIVEAVKAPLQVLLGDPIFGENPPQFVNCPIPWDGKQIRVTPPGKEPIISTTLSRAEMGQPYIYANLRYLHVSEDMRRLFLERPHRLYFRDIFTQSFIIPYTHWSSSQSITHKLDIPGFYQALFIRFRYLARIKQNNYMNTYPSGATQWLTDLTFTVNGEPIVEYWGNVLFPQLANNTLLRRDVYRDIYYLVFGITPEGFPAATLNMTEILTNRGVFVFSPAAVGIPTDGLPGGEDIECTIFGMSWNVFETAGGRGKVLFM